VMPLAPTTPHNLSSSKTEARIPCRLGKAPSKAHHRFQWVQSDQAPRIIKELRACLSWPAAISLDQHHQTSKEGSASWGARFCSPNFWKSSNQKCLEKTQEDDWWFPLPDHTTNISCDAEDPSGARWSAVQHLLCTTNHMKKRHLLGAQVFQIRSHGLN
jgi:hypothetical protein